MTTELDLKAIVGSRLKLARQFRGLSKTELAAKVGVSAGSLSQYEAGRIMRAREAVVKSLSEVLGFPTAFLSDSPPPPQIEHGSCRYRGQSRVAAKDRQFVESRAALFHEAMLVVDKHVEFPAVDVPALPRKPEEAAAACRRAWGLGDGPIPNVVDELEWHGVWVYRLCSGIAPNVDAFSYWLDGRSVVVLNPAKDDPFRFRYDASHELGHLCMHRSPDLQPVNARVMETEANAFASAFLLPARSWMAEGPASSEPNDYLPLKIKWRVSVAAMIRRSKDLEMITPRQYETAMIRYSQYGWRRSEPDRASIPAESPRVLALALAALREQGKASAAALSRRLGLTEETLAAVLGDEASMPPVVEMPNTAEGGDVLNFEAWQRRRHA